MKKDIEYLFKNFFFQNSLPYLRGFEMYTKSRKAFYLHFQETRSKRYVKIVDNKLEKIILWMFFICFLHETVKMQSCWKSVFIKV